MPAYLQSPSQRFLAHSVSTLPLGSLFDPDKAFPGLGLETLPSLLLVLGSFRDEAFSTIDAVEGIVPARQGKQGRCGSEVGLGRVGAFGQRGAGIPKDGTVVAEREVTGGTVEQQAQPQLTVIRLGFDALGVETKRIAQLTELMTLRSLVLEILGDFWTKQSSNFQRGTLN